MPQQIKLSRSTLKYLAVFTMTLNHFAHLFLEPGSFWWTFLTDVGYFTAITMCFLLTEGYYYTHSKTAYVKRLLLFAAVSQLPYDLAFRSLGMRQPNVLFTLLLCFLILWLREKPFPGSVRAILILLLVFLSLFMDWGLCLPIAALLFAWSHSAPADAVQTASGFSKKRLALSYLMSAALFGSLEAAEAGSLLLAVCSALPLLVSGTVVLFFYDGSRRPGTPFSKWFFYAYYPAHLLILVLAKHLFF